MRTLIFNKYESNEFPVNESGVETLLCMDREEIENQYKLYGLPQEFSCLLIHVSNKENEHGVKRRKFFLAFVKIDYKSSIMIEAMERAVEGDTEIYFPSLNKYELFEYILNRSDHVVNVWTYDIFLPLLFYMIRNNRVICQNKDKAFTVLMEVTEEQASTLVSNQIEVEVVRRIRRVLGQIIDPRHEWLGAKGTFLTIAHNKYTNKYCLVARKPNHEGYLSSESCLHYLDIVIPMRKTVVS